MSKKGFHNTKTNSVATIRNINIINNAQKVKITYLSSAILISKSMFEKLQNFAFNTDYNLKIITSELEMSTMRITVHLN